MDTGSAPVRVKTEEEEEAAHLRQREEDEREISQREHARQKRVKREVNERRVQEAADELVVSERVDLTEDPPVPRHLPSNWGNMREPERQAWVYDWHQDNPGSRLCPGCFARSEVRYVLTNLHDGSPKFTCNSLTCKVCFTEFCLNCGRTKGSNRGSDYHEECGRQPSWLQALQGVRHLSNDDPRVQVPPPLLRREWEGVEAAEAAVVTSNGGETSSEQPQSGVAASNDGVDTPTAEGFGEEEDGEEEAEEEEPSESDEEDAVGGFLSADRGDYQVDGNGHVTVPNGITEICEGAIYEPRFHDHHSTTLTSVTLPDSLTVIGDSAFIDCSSLTAVTLPDSLTVIGVSAFESCSAFTTITLPASLTEIEFGAFRYCSSLTAITLPLPDSLTSIGDCAFFDCPLDAEVKTAVRAINFWALPPSIDAQGHVTVPEGVTRVGDGAFYKRTSLASITLPDGLTSIGAHAFYGCSLANITLPDSLTTIGYWAFAICHSITTIRLPRSLTAIGDSAFHNCSALTTITLPLPNNLNLADDDGEPETLDAKFTFYGCPLDAASVAALQAIDHT